MNSFGCFRPRAPRRKEPSTEVVDNILRASFFFKFPKRNLDIEVPKLLSRSGPHFSLVSGLSFPSSPLTKTSPTGIRFHYSIV